MPLTRRALLAAALGSAGALAVGCRPPSTRPPRRNGLDAIRYQLGWLPQPEKGGLFQAQVAGLYRQHGLDVEIVPGAPQLNALQLLAAGRVDIVDSDSFRVLSVLRSGIPAVAIAAFGQRAPNVLLSHAHSGNDTLADLRGKPVMVSAPGRQSYWPWLRARYGYDDAQLRPYGGSLAPFLVDPTLSCEGFVTSEPFQLRRQHIEPVVHVLADHGYSAYSAVMLASSRLVAQRDDVVRRFVAATRLGWYQYLHGDSAAANAAIKRGNPYLDDARIAYSIAALKQTGIVESGDALQSGPGAMTDRRWQDFYHTMVAAEALPARLDVASAYTLRYVNERWTPPGMSPTTGSTTDAR
ncbi:ABC transporter substrate-binding protein [Solimonas marina]|uniref:ABC transporter substrate-binding protein n=1 Tax=Solimonas marina TaxID=2714601 RepID=A0A969WDM7_9GAMM|nr:ABC transporter substrate-binding protein [Solimonas marina]NKF24629.1 ABC transporter substrate-binding protein [Solimonas marina]